mmetsp:Transcript_3596/g.2178  ORF Transcript_3596/g.2178 Transcript_3596/m.2178 type:complete len:149 (+) Transcript_3596:724-1170(+)|eukprot:CAMPEP_0201281910 /NCGR_PEP_ID=MMETSP1317-20130820/4368_1 /ASSEMBLY_ACC=CAM_ASM_000770 /TAXON_ID=187299 /ORGANISM="Undescribed Undescribed, Strain Undescribed" /LENGTH=148 /DNA_ID=CAMNT_0047593141 /DNA_START=877 /DNA_END=1323 /DNA_ORIENTATION=+
MNGHSIESRVYAEDPIKGFLPSVGHLLKYREPKDVRVDTGVREGDEIPIYYDPIISKVVSHGANRDQAIVKLRNALENYVIRGVDHNINFVIDVLKDPKFNSGKYTTKFVEETYPDGFSGARIEDYEMRHLAEITAFSFRNYKKKDPN